MKNNAALTEIISIICRDLSRKALFSIEIIHEGIV